MDIEPIPPSLQGKEVVKIRGLTKTFHPFGKPKMTAVKGNKTGAPRPDMH